MNKLRIGAALMASGASSRYGSNKLEATYNGQRLIDLALNAIPTELLDAVAVVTGYGFVIEAAKARGFGTVLNRFPELSVSHTVHLATQRLMDMDAIMFMVADQPLLRRETLVKLIDLYRTQADVPAALAHDGARKNPVIFPKSFFETLLRLPVGKGGSYLLTDLKLNLLETEKKELVDIDTLSDWDKIYRL